MSRKLNAQEKPTISKQKCVSCTCRDYKMGNSFLVYFKDTASVARELKVRWLLEKAGKNKKGLLVCLLQEKHKQALQSRLLQGPRQFPEEGMTPLDDSAQVAEDEKLEIYHFFQRRGKRG